MPLTERFEGIDDALKLATCGAPSWNDDKTRVGYQRFADGETAFVSQPVGSVEETDLSLNVPDNDTTRQDGNVSEYAWRPSYPNTVAVVKDSDVVQFNVETGNAETLAGADANHSSLSWHPDGGILAYVRGGSLWLHDVDAGTIRELTGNLAELFGPTPVEWDAEGRYIATVTEAENESLTLTVYEPEREAEKDDDPPIAWTYVPESEGRIVTDTFEWAGDCLIYAENGHDGIDRRYRAVRPDMENPPYARGDILLSERHERGLASMTLVGHDTGRLAVVAAPIDHYHLYIIDIETRGAITAGELNPGFDGPGITAVTAGAFEARGDATDAPAWDKGGERLAYVTNEHDVGERHLHVAAIDNSGITDIAIFDDIDGNTVSPSWGNDRIACLRAGRTDPADVHVFDTATEAIQRVSVSYPSPNALSWFPDPEPISFESSDDGETVYGYLYTPADIDPDGDRPAIVWAHGGPSRQMRRGFHHTHAYAFFHMLNHILVNRGYPVLEVNYRGGIGYGRDYETGIYHAIGETDVQDCIDAATFLRDHEGVGDRVGLWGISYGGFLANAVATMSNSVDCVVSFAGIWDWRESVRYMNGPNWEGSQLFARSFGGHPDDPDPAIKERYGSGSPSDHVEGLETPLFALHGTADPNVSFDQMDYLVSDLVDHGTDFEMAYYPGEGHMFQKPTTWRDAMGRIFPFFDKHLQ